jgi:hypothetical protein
MFIFYGEFDGMRDKRALVKIIGERLRRFDETARIQQR